MSKAANIAKIVVAAVASAFGSLAVADGLPPSWNKWVIIGLAFSTAISSTLTKSIGESKKDEQK